MPPCLFYWFNIVIWFSNWAGMYSTMFRLFWLLSICLINAVDWYKSFISGERRPIYKLVGSYFGNHALFLMEVYDSILEDKGEIEQVIIKIVCVNMNWIYRPLSFFLIYFFIQKKGLKWYYLSSINTYYFDNEFIEYVEGRIIFS